MAYRRGTLWRLVLSRNYTEVVQLNVSLQNDINFRQAIFHGKCSGEFEPRFTGTDYFQFYHKPCNEVADITHVLMDHSMRIIFNLKCRKCGKQDALKCTPEFKEIYDALENKDYRILEYLRRQLFHLSPEYEKCLR